MTTTDALIAFAAAVRADRAANPNIAGDGVALELLIAPRFQTLIEAVLPELSARPVRVLPEYRRTGIGRPDLAFATTHSPARAFIELKEPRKQIAPDMLAGHDASQFKRFCELPIWALTNFWSIDLYRRSELIDQAQILPSVALDSDTSNAAAERMIRGHDCAPFERVLRSLVMNARAPEPRNAREVAEVLANAARLVREIVLASCAEGLDPVVDRVRAEFNETLFARAEAGGYDISDADVLFSSAFAQTLLFGLLLAREAGGGTTDVGADAYTLLPDNTYPLLRGTLRALTLDEVRAMLGVGFDVALDAVNSVHPALLLPENGRDPVLYLYEDFLRVFDESAVAKYGVYYTPPEIVRLIVAETDRALREHLGTEGLIDRRVQLLDPACGTGTFLIAAAQAAAESATARYGEGMAGPVVSAFAQRMHGFELLVGPYTVAHYRVLREVAGRGGGANHLPIYLTDTLAPPAGAAVQPHLDFMGAPLVAEREAADRIKRDAPIIAVIGNPPYKRLKRTEVMRLVGADMVRRWADLRRPVQEAGLGRSLNALSDLYVAFYRWALWRIFEAPGAQHRGVLGFITNRNFLTGTGFGGLRKMLRERFDHIRIIDFRGEGRGSLPATVAEDQNVFNIEVGVCVLIAVATGERRPGQNAVVQYSDVWRRGAFTRQQKLQLALGLAAEPQLLPSQGVAHSGLMPLKPRGFVERDWPSLPELLQVRSNAIVTYRDGFSYATTAASLERRLEAWLATPLDLARRQFGDSALNSAAEAHVLPFDRAAIEPVGYRPLDRRFLYAKPQFVDRRVWGNQNVALMALPGGTGVGPAVWSHSLIPDQHAFRGSYGGWVFPLWNHARDSAGHFLSPALREGLRDVYGEHVAPQDVFDAMLALLSATSYTMRFAHDIEDDFPHVPFPAELDVFRDAARIGARIREVQGFAEPRTEFRQARLVGQATTPNLNAPTPSRAFTFANEVGAVALIADQSLRITNLSRRAWEFSVSGHQVLYKWLRARNGEPLSGEAGATLLRSAVETVWRIEELLSLYDESDTVLAQALEAPLSRARLGLPPRPESGVVAGEDEDASD